MIAYKSYVDLESTNLNLKVPLQFVGKKIEVIILENTESIESAENTKQKLEVKPHKVGLVDKNWVWSRENCYD